jgi:5-deoxy-glucuronate isomerase
MQYTEANLLFRPAESAADPTLITRVTADQAGWDLLNMEVRRLNKDAEWAHETGDCEAALVILGGRCRVTSNQGSWETLGERPDVFSGKPYALYLPRHTAFKLTALTDNFEIAHCWVPTDRDHPAALVTPAESQSELRGGHNASRQINGVIMPGFDCHRIVCCEVYTPGGNWSSYPPHKHDSHRTDNAGNLTEADLEEFYFYKIDKPGGYALQRIYTDDRRIDSAVVAHDNDIVLVPEGYHPVSAAYGYNCYYLNFLAGSAQSLACSDDPAYAWTKDTWSELDPRVPLVR